MSSGRTEGGGGDTGTLELDPIDEGTDTVPDDAGAASRAAALAVGEDTLSDETTTVPDLAPPAQSAEADSQVCQDRRSETTTVPDLPPGARRARAGPTVGEDSLSDETTTVPDGPPPMDELGLDDDEDAQPLARGRPKRMELRFLPGHDTSSIVFPKRRRGGARRGDELALLDRTLLWRRRAQAFLLGAGATVVFLGSAVVGSCLVAEARSGAGEPTAPPTRPSMANLATESSPSRAAAAIGDGSSRQSPSTAGIAGAQSAGEGEGSVHQRGEPPWVDEATVDEAERFYERGDYDGCVDALRGYLLPMAEQRMLVDCMQRSGRTDEVCRAGRVTRRGNPFLRFICRHPTHPYQPTGAATSEPRETSAGADRARGGAYDVGFIDN